MRFIYGALFGSTVMCVLGVTVCNAWLSATVESQPAYRILEEENSQLRLELDMQRRKNLNLNLDLVNPRGVDVPNEDKIPAPKVPFPTRPVDPTLPQGAPKK